MRKFRRKNLVKNFKMLFPTLDFLICKIPKKKVDISIFCVIIFTLYFNIDKANPKWKKVCWCGGRNTREFSTFICPLFMEYSCLWFIRFTNITWPEKANILLYHRNLLSYHQKLLENQSCCKSNCKCILSTYYYIGK